MVDSMMQTCKECNVAKALDEFPLRRWKLKDGTPREGPRKECYECRRAADNSRYADPANNRRARHLEYKQENAERISKYRTDYYEQNRDKWLDRETGWRFNEKSKGRDQAYEARPEVREAAKLRGREWRQNNKPRLVLKTLARKAKVAQATPLWSDPAAILAIYAEAERKTLETGIEHEVDHYFPLVSDRVCGLHVEFNLRVITANENRRKANKMPE